MLKQVHTLTLHLPISIRRPQTCLSDKGRQDGVSCCNRQGNGQTSSVITSSILTYRYKSAASE